MLSIDKGRSSISRRYEDQGWKNKKKNPTHWFVPVQHTFSRSDISTNFQFPEIKEDKVVKS